MKHKRKSLSLIHLLNLVKLFITVIVLTNVRTRPTHRIDLVDVAGGAGGIESPFPQYGDCI